MRAVERWRLAAAAGVLTLLTAPVLATTLQRESLDQLVAGNSRVIVGEVLDAQSRWNDDGTFILTDVRIAPVQALKGKAGHEMTVTLMGGTVAGTTALIVGGADLRPGRPYVLFLNEEDLPGAPRALTVRDHCQGVFDLAMTPKGELRARSQAYDQPLLPDRDGAVAAPGAAVGIEFGDLVKTLREIVARQQTKGGAR